MFDLTDSEIRQYFHAFYVSNRLRNIESTALPNNRRLL